MEKKKQICDREEKRQICVDKMGNYTRPDYCNEKKMESVQNYIYLHLMNRYVFCALKTGSNIYI